MTTPTQRLDRERREPGRRRLVTVLVNTPTRLVHEPAKEDQVAKATKRSSRCHSGERVSSWPSRGERRRLSPNTSRLPLSLLDPTTPAECVAGGRVVQ